MSSFASQKKIFAQLKGFGSFVPSKILSNQDLEKMVDTTDEWITTRTGIKERRILEWDKAPSDMAVEAVNNMKKRFPDFDPGALDMIIVATTTPDHIMPNTASIIQSKIGNKHAACFDLMAACSGWVYGMSIGDQFISSGKYKNILVIGCEAISRIVDWKDRNTCVLFGDGCGVTWLQASSEPGIIDFSLGSYGEFGNLLSLEYGGYKYDRKAEHVQKSLDKVSMKGKELFKVAVKAMSRSAIETLEKTNFTISDLSWFIPHQANTRIMDAVAEKFEIPKEKILFNIVNYGNTSSACVPMMLSDNYGTKIKKGDLILSSVFGGGVTFGSLLFRV